MELPRITQESYGFKSECNPLQNHIRFGNKEGCQLKTEKQTRRSNPDLLIIFLILKKIGRDSSSKLYVTGHEDKITSIIASEWVLKKMKKKSKKGKNDKNKAGILPGISKNSDRHIDIYRCSSEKIQAACNEKEKINMRTGNN